MRKGALIYAAMMGLLSAAWGQSAVIDSLRNELRVHTDPDQTRAELLNNLAFELYYINPAQSLDFSNQAHAVSLAINFLEGVSLSYRHAGLVYWTQAMFSDALDHFYKGLRIADSLGYETVKADIIGNIGLVQNGRGEYQKALKSFEESYEIHKKLGNKPRMVTMMNNIGDCYFYLKQTTEALHAYQYSLEMGKSISFLTETNERNIGNILEAQGDFEGAERHYYQSKEIGDKVNQRREMTLIRKSLASVHFKKREFEKAESWAHEAIQFGKLGNYRAALRDTYFLLSQILNAKSDYAGAFKYFQLGTIYKDSIQNLNETTRLATVQRNFELQLKQTQIDSLEKDAALKQEEISITRLVLGASTLIFIMLLLAGYISLRGYRNEKSSALALKEQNAEISAQNDQLHEQQAELQALNETITRQTREVTLQREQMAEKNRHIELLNMELSSINRYLEKKVAERTHKLAMQNSTLSEYASFNIYGLNEPVEKIKNIVTRLVGSGDVGNEVESIASLENLLAELDRLVRAQSAKLNDSLSVFGHDERLL